MPARKLLRTHYGKPTENNRPEHYSGIQTFFSCPMKYYYSCVHEGHGIKTTSSAPAMAFGTVIHNGLASYVQHDCDVRSQEKIIKDAELSFDNIMYPCSDEKADKLFILRANIKAAMIISFFNLFKPDDKDVKTFAEIPFYVPEYNFYGTVDRVDKNTDVCDCVVRNLFEYKTSAKISKNLIDGITESIQHRLYALCLKKIDKKIDYVTIVIIKKTSIKGRKGETREELGLRIGIEYMLKSDEHCIKTGYFVINSVLEEAEKNLRIALECIRNTNLYYKNTGSCFSNNFKCEYYMICKEGISLGYENKEPVNLTEHKKEKPWL